MAAHEGDLLGAPIGDCCIDCEPQRCWPVEHSADLRRFDVRPFPLAAAAHRTDSGFEIELILITDVHDSGYGAMPIASHTVAYANGRPPEQGSAASAEFDHALREALAVFARKLARALRDQGACRWSVARREVVR